MTNVYYITNLRRGLDPVRLAGSVKEAVAYEGPSNDVDCFREERGIISIYELSVRETQLLESKKDNVIRNNASHKVFICVLSFFQGCHSSFVV